MSGGELKAMTPGDLPGWDETGKVTLSDGRLILPLSETNWTESTVHSVIGGAQFTSNNGMVALENQDDVTLTTDFSMGSGSFGKFGDGVMTVGSTRLDVTNGTPEVFDSEWNLTGNGTHFLNIVNGSLDVSQVTFAFTNASVLPRKGGCRPIARAEGGIIGEPTVLTGLPSECWNVVVRENNLCLVYSTGTILVVR